MSRRRIALAIAILSALPDPAAAHSVAEAVMLATLPGLLLGMTAGLALTLGLRATAERLIGWGDRRRLERHRVPAAITARTGAVLHANRAFLEKSGGSSKPIAALIGSMLSGPDAAQIYRLSRMALELGSASLPCRCRRNGRQVTLNCVAAPGDRLIWTFVPEEMTGALRDAFASPYADAPFCHLRRGFGQATVNASFEEAFGSDPDPVLQALYTGDRSFAGERVLPCADGTDRVFRVIQIAGQGPLAGLEDHFFFAAERGSAEEALLDALPTGLLQTDRAGRILWLNARAVEILGPPAVPGQVLAASLHSEARPALERMLQPLAAGAKPQPEILRLSGAGAARFVKLSVGPAAAGRRSDALIVLSDAEDLRQLQENFAQSQKMEAIGKLAGGIAHDFNNVLTAISGHADLLLLGKDATHHEHADLMQIRLNTNRAATLVRQLLAFSRKQTLQPQVLGVQDVVAEMHYLLDRLIGEHVTLGLEIGRGLYPVRADQQQLEQAIMNLVVNARDAMPEGGTVTIAARNRHIGPGGPAPAGAYVEIAVADRGHGIPPDLIDKVFDPFFTTKPQGQGTGLGLSTVYGIVRQSGGAIYAENREGGGARFVILLPRAEIEAEAAAEPAPPPPERTALTGEGAVLLIEDEDPVRAFAARALRLRGYEVTEAASGEEAMAVLETGKPFDLLVSDVVMPGIDGPSFAKQARALRPGLRIIFISGYAEENLRGVLGEDDFLFLPKPFSLDDLTAQVKRAFSGVDA